MVPVATARAGCARRSCAALLLALCLGVALATVGAAAREDVRMVEPREAVAGRPGLVYADLLREMIPDLTLEDASGHQAVGHTAAPHRDIVEPAPVEPARDPDPIHVDLLTALDFEASGQPRTALLVDLGPSDEHVDHTTLLGLFDLSATPHLLDLVEVGMQETTSFADVPPLLLRRGDEALVLQGWHGNSNQSYASYALLFVRDGKWRLIDRFSTFSDRYCAFAREQTPSFATRRRRSHAYADILVTVRETLKASGETCDAHEPRARSYAKTYTATYRWQRSTGGFIGARAALTRLEARNETRF